MNPWIIVIIGWCIVAVVLSVFLARYFRSQKQ